MIALNAMSADKKLLTIRNGRAADVFTVTVSGMPVAWDYSQKIYVAHDSQRTIRFEAGASEQGEHSILFKATSLSSNEINQKYNEWSTDPALPFFNRAICMHIEHIKRVPE